MTSDGPNRIHRIRPNHREWSPPQVVCWDTETEPADTPDGELHRLRCWAATLTVRRSRYSTGLGRSDGYGYTTGELADQIEIWAEGQRCLWIYAHNLSFDLAVTRLPAELHARGWQVTGHAVSSDSPWLRMKLGSCVLTFADSWGWLRAPLHDIGADVGYRKPDLPAWAAGDDEWLARCQADAGILTLAMVQLMDWWDEQQLGSWTLTGSAGGWNSWRHRTTEPLPLIVPDPAQTAADREAIYGGRREAFAHGELTGGPWQLLDFQSAYPTIAASFPLPCARQGNFGSLPLDTQLVGGDQYGIIAEVEIQAGAPRYPVRINGRVAYPAGRFRTVLAGPEIAEARRLGHLVSIGPGWLHKLSPHMREWASWVLEVTADQRPDVPRVARRAVKHWGRAVIGKTAAKGWRTIPLESLGGTGWDYRAAWNQELGAPSHLTDVCGQAAETVSIGDGDNAYPAILAWVESWTRVFLGRAIDAIGRQGVATCDTDGLIAAATGDGLGRLAAADLGPLRMRVKGTYDAVKVLGPQHVITPGDTKLAGIPRSAQPGADGKLTALLWPKLASQMQLRPGTTEPGYLRTRQTYTLANSYVTGWVMASGRVQALRADICDQGKTHLLPFPYQSAFTPPAELQARHLKEIIQPLPQTGESCSFHTPRSNGSTGESSRYGPTQSSGSFPNLTSHAGERPSRWLTTGVRYVSQVLSAYSGKTRISWPTRTISALCGRRSNCGRTP